MSDVIHMIGKLLIFFALVGAGIAQDGSPASLFIELGHTGKVTSVEYSPDGKLIASASDDHTVRLWHVDSRRELWSFVGHSEGVNSVAFSPDGALLASGGDDNSVRLWDIANGRELRKLEGSDASFRSVSFSPEGKSLAGGSRQGDVILWDLASGKELRRLETRKYGLTVVAFSPDGNLLATATVDETVTFWNPSTGAEVRKIERDFPNHLPGQPGLQIVAVAPVVPIAFSPDGKTLAIGTTLSNPKKAIRLIDVVSGSERSIDETVNVYSLGFSPDGQTLASGGGDKSVRLWNISSGKQVRNLTADGERIYSLNFSPDGQSIVAGCSDRALRVWDALSGNLSSVLPGRSESSGSVSISVEGKLAMNVNRAILIWDLAKGSTQELQDSEMWSASPDGSVIATSLQDNAIGVLDVLTKTLRHTLPSEDESMVHDVTFSPNGKVIASSDEQSIHLWNTASGAKIKTLRGHTSDVWQIAFSPDGKTLVSVSMDETIRLWDTSSGRQLKNRPADDAGLLGFTSVAFGPDGKMIAAASSEDFRLFDASTLEAVALKQRESVGIEVDHLIFGPTPTLLASGSPDGTIRLWDTKTRTEISIFRGHTSRIYSLCFSADGKFMGSSSADGTIRLWSTEKATELVALVPFDKEWFAITPEGRFDMSKSLDDINGLHWTVNNEILKPVPIEAFMRHYYEPNLLGRVMKCNKENTCEKEFKPLPSIGAINRIQTKLQNPKSVGP